MKEREMTLLVKEGKIKGDLTPVEDGKRLVIFAHGSGSSRKSPRNRFVANILNQAKLSTLLCDLLTMEEEKIDAVSAELRFNIPFLSDRLTEMKQKIIEEFPDSEIAFFGASTGAAAALMSAAKDPHRVKAIVSRGGRPDLALGFLERVKAPTLLLVGSLDTAVIDMNQAAYERLTCEKEMILIEGATHLFEESGTLEQVAHHAAQWFSDHFF